MNDQFIEFLKWGYLVFRQHVGVPHSHFMYFNSNFYYHKKTNTDTFV